MGNIIRMDLYRLHKTVSYKVCLLIVALMNLVIGPMERGIYLLTKRMVGEDDARWVGSMDFSEFLDRPFGTFDIIVVMLSIVWFTHADIENGYIKNIAGQLPKKGYTVISKFITLIVHNLIFTAAALIGQTVGYMIVKNVNFTNGISTAAGHFCVRFLLMMAMSSLVLFLTTALGARTLGSIAAVLWGGGFLSLAYMGVDMLISKLFKLEDFTLGNYMPDSLFHTGADDFENGRGIIVGAAFCVVLLVLSIRIFNKRDVK